MKIKKEERAQGAVEYLLILAAALTVVGIAVQYITNLAQEAGSEVQNQYTKIDNLLDGTN